MAAALSDEIFHLPSTHFQTRWLGIVGSLLEDKGRLVRLLEGPFVVLAQIRPLQFWYNIVMNVVHYIEIKTSELDLRIGSRLGVRPVYVGACHPQVELALSQSD